MRTVMPLTLLLALRPVELWTPWMGFASLVLLVVVVVGLGWWIAAGTAPYEHADPTFDD